MTLFLPLVLLLLKRCRCQSAPMSITEELASTLMQGSKSEISPPTPEIYAEKDAELRKRWEENGIFAAKRPKEAFGSILEEMAWTQWHHPTCHSEAHDMGKRLFAEQDVSKMKRENALDPLVYKLKLSVDICEYRCTGGCLHGAMGAFVRSAVRAKVPLPEIGSTLGQQCTSEPLLNLLSPGECAHALGHAIVSSRAGNVNFCESALVFTPSNWTISRSHTTFDSHQLWGRALAHYCAGGIFMEDYFKIFHRLESRQRAPRCHRTDIPSTAKASCFYYGLRHNWRDLGIKMHRICGLTDSALTASCIFGAASGATMLPVYRKDLTPAVRRCQVYQPDSRLRRACIDGLVFRADKFFSNELVDICSLFNATDDQHFCLAVGRAGMYSLSKAPLLRSYQVDDPN